jgi:tape measure domain-containing protein
MAEQAYAYVTLIPVAKGFKSALTKELNGVQGAGNVAGEKTGSGFAGGFKKALGGLAIAGAAATAALGGVLASGFARLSGIEEAQAKLLGLGNSVEDVSQIMDNALSAVRGTAFGMADAATIAASAVAAGVEPGEELARYLKITADSAYIAGAGLDEMGSILNKATTRGVATNEVLTQLAERGIPIYQMLADTVGVTAGEIFDLASQGEISSKVLMDSLENNIAGAALESGNTVTGAFANMRAAIQRVGANLLGPSFGYFKDFFLGIITFLGPIEEKAKVVGQVIADFLGERLIPYFSDLFLIGETLGADNVFAKVFDDIRGALSGFFEGGALGDVVAKLAEFRMMIFNAIIDAVPAVLDAIVEFLPVLIDFFVNTMLPELIAQFETIINEIISLITLLLPGLVTSLIGMIPDLIDAGIKLFNTLVQAVIDITPDLIDAVIYLLPEIITTLLDMLPQLVESAVELFTALVEAVPQIIPPLIIALVDLLPVILETVVDMLPELIDAAFELFSGIMTAIFQAGPEIYGAIADLLPEMISTIVGMIPDFIQAGIDIIGGLVEGIIENGPRLLGEAIGSVVGGMVESAKGLLGIRSPSRVFRDIGKYVGEGMAQGIESQTKVVETAAESLGTAAVTAVESAVEDIEEKFTVITSIPALLGEAMEETVSLSIAQAKRMAKEMPGFFAEFSESGELLRSYTGYGQDLVLPTAGGGTANLGSLIDDLNSLVSFAGANTVAEIDQISRAALNGASTQEALNALTGQISVITADGQRIIGQTLTPYMQQLIDQGGTLESTEQSIDKLTGAIEALAKTVSDQGLTPFAKGGLVTGPTSALIGEAGPEVVIPLDRFESMMGMSGGSGKTVNYFAAPNQSIDSEQDLFQAMRRAKVVANW